MSGYSAGERPAIQEMWDIFWRQATRNRPGRKVPSEVRAAYYAGCHNMLDQMLTMMRSGETTSDAWGAVWQKWADELGNFPKIIMLGKCDPVGHGFVRGSVVEHSLGKGEVERSVRQPCTGRNPAHHLDLGRTILAFSLVGRLFDVPAGA
jgi:hypothetical protein